MTRKFQGKPAKGSHEAIRHDTIPRHMLPIPDVTPVALTTFDARDPDTRYPPIRQLRPPPGAPNVLVVLIDDAGFGSSSAFGGPCQTPTFEKLAAGGLKYTRFHTTALCSPTRAALLSGRNHHSVGMGAITEFATSAPGQNSMKPNTCAALAETLKLNGYSTAQFGKCHEVPVWESSAVGPFDHWPTGGGGFQYFYGFIGGETHQYYPNLFEGTTRVEPKRTPEQGYTLNEDLADHAISWIRQQKSLTPDKPFFVYYAPGATHAPHHVPKEWADKYKGKFDRGWDAVREETFMRQRALGVIPRDCALTKRHAEIPAWEAVDPKMKPVLTRQMEVYAGFMEQTDHHLGRVIDALTDLEILDDTVIYLIIGDNGASAEGSLQGTFNEMVTLGGFGHLETADSLIPRIDELGGPQAYNHYAVGWAHAMDTPYQWTKQVASHWGGTRNGTIVHWPKGIKGRNELRHQFHHVIDVAPTILELAGLPQPTMVNGVLQRPIEGVSMAYSFNEASAPDRHETQYFEMFGNRGIYHKGWTAVTKHRTPWDTGVVKTVAFEDDVWELYDTSKDWSQARDLASEQPDTLHKLQQLWLIEAVKYNVLPLDDRFAERGDSEMAGRPELDLGESPTRVWRTDAGAVAGDGEHGEQVARGHRPDRGAGLRCGRRHRRRRRHDRRLESVREERQAEVLLQLLWPRADVRRGFERPHAWPTSGSHGVCVRRRRHCQGRHSLALCGRQESRRGPPCPNRTVRVRRRVVRRGPRGRVAGDARLRARRRKRVHRAGELGRVRRRAPQPTTTII